MRIGVISDTHGLLRPEAVAALRGCERIVHAGDVGAAEILDTLKAIAPVTAVRGNVDTADWADALPEAALLEADGCKIWVLHNRNDLSSHPPHPGVRLIVTGHSHQPHSETIDGVVYLNPGSAGPRRFRLPITLAILETASWRIEFIDLAQTQLTVT